MLYVNVDFACDSHEAEGGDSSGNKKPQDPYLSVAREAACVLL
jgi:hypothetical protein